ncbi:peptide MFS transporter [Entomobacter blattae]|uniref:Dipeptide and tripeptide permease A n=1 Tax=Entomobacter blattae TaxID=2762277 RepID=A0A7H1NT78_9PROT|nr:oligopeptide:H+ symporter [Entomobacter blattae]QNT78988.1 Dipeptide and tripeptide permease A [Entomobacter blattae]
MKKHSPSSSLSSRSTFCIIALCQIGNMFAYAGVQSILLLYLVEKQNFSDSEGNILIGAFAAIYCITHIVGGWAGDRLFSHRATIIGGAGLLALGYLLLAIIPFHIQILYYALAIISLGNGFFSTNAASIIRALFTGEKNGNDNNMESIFTYYYLSINIGSVLAKFSIPWIQTHLSWQTAFFVCFFAALLEFFLLAKLGQQLFIPLSLEKRKRKNNRLFLALTSITLFIFTVLTLERPFWAEASMWVATSGVLAFLTLLYRKSALSEQYGLLILFVMMGQSILFFILFQQMDTSLTLLALRHVSPTFYLGDLKLFSWSAGQFKMLNPFWVIIFSPILIWAYRKNNQKTHRPLLAHKFFVGFIALSLSFFIWWIFCHFSNGHTLLSPWVMVGGYLFFSIGELMIAGLGLAAVAQYSPPHATGTMMGCYYIISGISLYIGSLIANWGPQSHSSAFFSPLESLHRYGSLFGILTLLACLGSFISACCFPLLRQWEQHLLTNSIKT